MDVLDATAPADRFAIDLATSLTTLTELLGQPGKTATSTRFVTAGRGGDNDIVVDKPEVSRRHLQLRQGTDFEVRDIGSSNGTVVVRDAERLELEPMVWVALLPGDTVVTLRDVPIFSVPS